MISSCLAIYLWVWRLLSEQYFALLYIHCIMSLLINFIFSVENIESNCDRAADGAGNNWLVSLWSVKYSVN